LEPRIVLSGTLEAIELNSGASSSPKEFVRVGDIALFVATDATHGRELWKTDGTPAGTVLLKDIQSGSTGSSPTGLTAINGIVYFSADDGASGRELWASDGTATGTVMVKDLYAGSSSSYDSYSYSYTSTANSSNPQNLTDVNGSLFFTADDGVNGRELWTSDGSAAGTVLVKDLNAGSSWDSSSYSYAADSSDPQNLTDVDGALFFTADDGVNGRELWISDGTATGTVLVEDLYAGSTTDSTSSSTTANSSDPHLLTDVAGTLFFVANDGTNGMELWKSDGTAAGTVLVKDIAAGSTGSFTDASSLIAIGDTLFFTADDGENGDELWTSDGTSAGTVLVKDIEAGSDGNLSKYTAFTDVDGVLFFSASDGVNGRELWKSDGTSSGTVMVKDIDTGDDSYYGTPNNTVAQDGVLSVTAAAGVLANDTDTDGHTLTATRACQPSYGSLTLADDGSFTYTPVSGYSGTDTFTYQAEDGSASSNVATVTISVIAASENETPVAVGDAYSLDEDTVLTLAASAGVLVNDSDPDGDALTAQVVSVPAYGTLTLNSDGSLTYTPNTGFNGTDRFLYQASDGVYTSDTVQVTITVNHLNTAPAAVSDSYTGSEDDPLVVAATAGVLANDSDADSDAIYSELVSLPSNGTVVLNSDGSFTYTPNADFQGTDTFLYAASDGAAYSADTTVTITVGAVNDPPVAVADTFRVAVDAMLAVYAENGVLANDTDADGDGLTATLISGPANGSLTLDTDGYLLYVPNDGFHGADTFSYVAGDGQLTSPVVTVTIHVNTLPVVPTDSYEVDEDTVLEVDAASGVLSNDVDLDGDSLTATLFAATAHGTLTLNADGSFTYTPNAGFHGTDSFTYAASDGWEDSLGGSVTISVASVNDAPTAVDDQYTVADAVLTIKASLGVLANDADPDGDALTATLASEPAYGTLTFNADGSLSYVPGAAFVDGDSFTYTVSDGVATSAPATVEISLALADLAEVRLEVASTDGTPVSTLTAGQAFVVNVYVEDLRDVPEGVFASYFDLQYDSSLVSVNGEIEYGSEFPNGHRADATTVGSVVDVGAFAGFTELGSGEFLLASVPFVTLANGVADFTADTTNASAGDDTRLFGLDTSVPLGQVSFVGVTLQIGPAGEGEAGDSSAWAADLVFAEDCDWLWPVP